MRRVRTEGQERKTNENVILADIYLLKYGEKKKKIWSRARGKGLDKVVSLRWLRRKHE